MYVSFAQAQRQEEKKTNEGDQGYIKSGFVEESGGRGEELESRGHVRALYESTLDVHSAPGWLTWR
jgi:hypothetical protein